MYKHYECYEYKGMEGKYHYYVTVHDTLGLLPNSHNVTGGAATGSNLNQWMRHTDTMPKKFI